MDLECLELGIHVRLTESKMDHLSQGQVLSLNRSVGRWCPCVALQKYLTIRPSSGPLLHLHQDGSHLIKFQFQAGLLLLFFPLGQCSGWMAA